MSDNPIQSAERLFHVLETLAQEESMSLTELSVRTGLHKSTVHRLLRSLICLGYAEQEFGNQSVPAHLQDPGPLQRLLHEKTG